MSTETHMPWYGKPNNDRFEMRVPIGMRASLVKYMFYINRRGKVMRSQAEFIQTLIDKELAAIDAEVQDHWNKYFMPRK